jgi:pimeloyl-ACP methyl ester carboxylesterase
MPEKLEIRLHGNASLPTLIYLPGLHGDWTLIGRFRRALAGRVQFVEITYPRTLDWSLDDYAAAVESALVENGISRGWLLGESFGSQVLWPLVARHKFLVEGIILAGGFVRHPALWAVRLGELLCGGVSLALLTRILFGYAQLARFRYRNSPEATAEIQEFIARRTELDRQAAKHRLSLITKSDLSSTTRGLELPVYALTGLFDPVVPWFWVRRWLKKNCASLRAYRIISRAGHNVLGTGAQQAADQVVRWITTGDGQKPR